MFKIIESLITIVIWGIKARIDVAMIKITDVFKNMGL